MLTPALGRVVGLQYYQISPHQDSEAPPRNEDQDQLALTITTEGADFEDQELFLITSARIIRTNPEGNQYLLSRRVAIWEKSDFCCMLIFINGLFTAFHVLLLGRSYEGEGSSNLRYYSYGLMTSQMIMVSLCAFKIRKLIR